MQVIIPSTDPISNNHAVTGCVEIDVGTGLPFGGTTEMVSGTVAKTGETFQICAKDKTFSLKVSGPVGSGATAEIKWSPSQENDINSSVTLGTLTVPNSTSNTLDYSGLINYCGGYTYAVLTAVSTGATATVYCGGA